MNMWVLNCKETSRSVSDAMDKNLPFSKRIGIHLHLMMCKSCARVAQQLKQLRSAVQGGAGDNIPPQTLNEEAKQRMRRKIEEHRQNMD